ncbi:Cytochrome P450 78A1 [Ananas comosus]|uniref:Cytochrome P450 78A1 n=1 Tax=Ananas comosus TaxID=4615 RepID=A0A199UUK1_ANACO|nr:Cytochrome P450 78A1 [Ananas comosus]
MFARAIGFAPNGAYWRCLRRIASTHLFAPRRVAADEPGRQSDCAAMLAAMSAEQSRSGSVVLRPHLQGAALNNIMGSVFGKHYDLPRRDPEAERLRSMVHEGFELLGAFNWSDHLPWLAHLYDPARVNQRCSALVPRVCHLVRAIIADHHNSSASPPLLGDTADFVDVLLSLQGDEKLEEDNMIAVLWVRTSHIDRTGMHARNDDTTALLTEWAMAELVLHPEVQSKLRCEIDAVVGPGRHVTDTDVARMPYLQAGVKETLRAHPPGPLLSWARPSTADVRRERHGGPRGHHGHG